MSHMSVEQTVNEAAVAAALPPSVVTGRGPLYSGPAGTVEPLIAALTPGTEYEWFKTNGSGLLLDIVTGVR